MKWLLVLAFLYSLGAVCVLFINMSMGPVTFGLSVSRAILWPVFILTGRPRGIYLDSGRSDYD